MDLSLIISLHIDAGPASDALSSLSRQAQIQIGWGGDVYDAPSVPAVHGVYSVAGGLCAVLQGTGLIWTYRGNYLMVTRAHPGEYEALCQQPRGWGPDFIQPPQVNWK